jgi:hypothetical protein
MSHDGGGYRSAKGVVGPDSALRPRGLGLGDGVRDPFLLPSETPGSRATRQQVGGRARRAGLLLVALVAGFPLAKDDVVFASLAVAVALLPLATGAAILRYRLHDLDRIISRTLAYGLLTVLLGLCYASAVLLPGQLLGGAGGQPPSWAIAGATLAVAALFQPARRRVQQLVDRRFNRRRYDAAMTIAAFSARLRQQVDLQALTAELLAVVDETMQPIQASLRSGEGRRRWR